MPEPTTTDDDRGNRMQELVALGQRVIQRVADPKVPLYYKLIPVAAMLYVLSPIDLIPDTIPVLTQIDDIAVMLIAARLFVDLAERNNLPETPEADEPETVTTTYRVLDE
jgi:uncharacterized membrane protein YkvA (DUF1232 family)